ncbi:hypothetical protein [Streptomyces sp. NPDC096339]|uniref:hypothetical protein n=1 Tax=Streptomyces sp. NPDC096339 TaxID=3366086 RepID=UPI003809D8FD
MWAASAQASVVLPPPDEDLAALKRRLPRALARLEDPTDRQAVRSFATWHHFRRLRGLGSHALTTGYQAMSARTHAAPTFGNPAHWAAALTGRPRTTRHRPERITAATDEAFHLRFLAQTAVPYAQMTTVDQTVFLIDDTTGSHATLTPAGDTWEVRQGGAGSTVGSNRSRPDAYDMAGSPGPESFTLHVHDGGQHLRDPQIPAIPLPFP